MKAIFGVDDKQSVRFISHVEIYLPKIGMIGFGTWRPIFDVYRFTEITYL